MPRKKRPRIARLDQVRISRDGEDAIIEFLDTTIATTPLRVGPQVQQMTDEEILLLFNQVIAAQIRNRDELGEYVAVGDPCRQPAGRVSSGDRESVVASGQSVAMLH